MFLCPLLLLLFIYLFIYTIFQEGDTFGMKAILPCGPLNIKHMKNKLYTYIQIANTNSVHCLSFRHYLKYETINMFSMNFVLMSHTLVAMKCVPMHLTLVAMNYVPLPLLLLL